MYIYKRFGSRGHNIVLIVYVAREHALMTPTLGGYGERKYNITDKPDRHDVLYQNISFRLARFLHRIS